MSLFEDLKGLVPECERLQESQMAYLLNNQTTKAIEARHKILSFSLQRLQPKMTIKKYLLHKGLDIKILQEKQKFIEIVFSIVQEIKTKNAIPKHSSAITSITLTSGEAEILNINKKECEPTINKKEREPTRTESKSIQDKYPILLEKYNKLLQEKTQKDHPEKTKNLIELRALYDSLLCEDRVKNELLPQKNIQLSIRKQLLFQSQIYQLKRQLVVYKEIASDKEVFVYNAQEQVKLILNQLQSAAGNPIQSLAGKNGIGSHPHGDQIADAIKRLKALEKYMTRGAHQNLETKDPHDFIYSSDFISSKNSQISLSDVANGILY
jgi:hypothetical protein